MMITKSKKKNSRKENRELVLNISMFLLNQESLRKLFWNVKNVNYNKMEQIVNIGINTTNGKLGTTLAKLRKTARYLSDHLYDQGLTYKKAKINFFIDKEDEQIERIYSLLENMEKTSEPAL